MPLNTISLQAKYTFYRCLVINHRQSFCLTQPVPRGKWHCLWPRQSPAPRPRSAKLRRHCPGNASLKRSTPPSTCNEQILINLLLHETHPTDCGVKRGRPSHAWESFHFGVSCFGTVGYVWSARSSQTSRSLPKILKILQDLMRSGVGQRSETGCP